MPHKFRLGENVGLVRRTSFGVPSRVGIFKVGLLLQQFDCRLQGFAVVIREAFIRPRK